MNVDPIIFLNRAFLVYDEDSARAVMPAMRFAVDSLYFWPQAQVERVKDNARDQWRRRIKELELEGLPDDPFVADEPEEKTMSKTREEKIRDLAAELRREFPDYDRKMLGCPDDAVADGWSVSIAERLLDATERETSQWPTDESFNAAREVLNSFDEPVTPLALQSALSAAMSVDPIVVAARKAISELRSWGRIESKTMETLEDAVSEAGLL